jgi:hypothetical protein
LERIGAPGTVEPGPWEGWYRVRYALDPHARVAVVLPLPGPPETLRNGRAFTSCARTWSTGDDERVELLLVGSPEVLDAYLGPLCAAEVDPGRIRFVPAPPGTSKGGLLNFGAREAACDFLCLWPEWLEVRSERWVDDLVGLASAPGVGVAGGFVRIVDGRLVHGPVVFGDRWPLQAKYGEAGLVFPFLVANFSAHSGPLAVRSETFAELGGLREDLGDLALVDLCLRARNSGLRCALSTEAQFGRPSAGPTLVNDPALLAGFRERWAELDEDPYYNPNFWHGSGDFIPLPSAELTSAE